MPSRAEARAEQGRARKAALVTLRGGRCSLCGYDRSLRALSFHHRSPHGKTQRHPSSRSGGSRFGAATLGYRKWPPDHDFWDEFWDCDLVCANCHMEQEEQDDIADWKTLPIDPTIFAALEAPGATEGTTRASTEDAND